MSSVDEWSAVEDGNTHLDEYDLERQINPHSPLNRYAKKIMAAVKAKCDSLQADDGSMQRAIENMQSAIGSIETGGVSVTATGTAASRGLSERFADSLNALDFGAKGDGSTDDSSALQSALDAASQAGKPLVVPAGTYRLGFHLVFRSNTTVFGYGATILRCYDKDSAGYGSTAWLQPKSGETVCRDIRIYGLDFNNNGQTYHASSQNVVTAGPLTSGVSFRAKDIWFVDCTFRNWVNQHALDLAGVEGLAVLRCVFRGVLYDSSLTDGSDGQLYAWNRWEAIQIDSAGDVFDRDWLVFGCRFEGLDNSFVAPRTGIGQHSGEDYVDASYRNIKIVGNTFNGCGYAGVTLYGVSDSIVSENYFYDCHYGVEVDTRISCRDSTLYRFASDRVRIEGNVFFKPETSASYKENGIDAIQLRTYIVNYDTEFTASFSGEKVAPDCVAVTGNTVQGYYRTLCAFGCFNLVLSRNMAVDCHGLFTGAGSGVTIEANRTDGGSGIFLNPSQWTYVPNRTEASASKNVVVSGNTLHNKTVQTFQVNATGHDFVTFAGNVVYDDYEKGEEEDAYVGVYFFASSGKTASALNNIVYAAEERDIEDIVANGTSGAVSGNLWFVNGVLQ